MPWGRHRGGGRVPISYNALQHYPECHGADTGGVPISHNALQHYPECHGADTRGGTRPGPARGGSGQVQLGGYPARGVPCWGYPTWVPPSQDGGTQIGYPQQGNPPGQIRMGGTQFRQQKEYSLHGRRYASCIHAGGLSCSYFGFGSCWIR